MTKKGTQTPQKALKEKYKNNETKIIEIPTKSKSSKIICSVK